MAADSLMSQFSDLKMKKGKQWSQFIFAFGMCIFFQGSLGGGSKGAIRPITGLALLSIYCMSGILILITIDIHFIYSTDCQSKKKKISLPILYKRLEI